MGEATMTVKEIEKRLKLMKKYRKRLRRIAMVASAAACFVTLDDIYDRLDAMSAYYEAQKILEINRAAKEEMENHFER